jgi:hypothetical protein
MGDTNSAASSADASNRPSELGSPACLSDSPPHERMIAKAPGIFDFHSCVLGQNTGEGALYFEVFNLKRSNSIITSMANPTLQ